MTEEKKKVSALESAMKEIESRFGEGAIMRVGDSVSQKIERVTSGSLSIDIALGGGWPRGRIIEVYGPESAGKTTLCLHAVAEFQREGGAVGFVDAEHSLDLEYAKKIGVDTDSLLLSQPDCGEQALEIVEALIRSGEVKLIVVDSVAALTPRSEIEGSMGEAQMGVHARLMSQALRKITAITHKTGTTIIFINQIRSKIGVVYGSPEVTTGGNALKFYTSIRVDVRKGVKLEEGAKENKEFNGNIMKVKVVKNKVAPPFKTTEVDILFDVGIDKLGDLFGAGLKYKLIGKGGAFYTYGETTVHGRQKMLDFLKDNPKIRAEVDKEVRKRLIK